MTPEGLKATVDIIHTVGLTIVAIAGVATSVLAYLTKRAVAKMGEGVSDVVKHTNSMKDELVAAVKEAATATGKEAGRKEVHDERAKS